MNEISDKEKEQIYKEVLYTQVRVRTDRAGGSGTIVYSKKNSKGTYSTFVLTCHHVIDDSISVVSEWAPPPIGREIKREYRKVVNVEFFDYENVPHGHRPLNYSADAEIVCYDKTHDMALLKLRTLKQAQNICSILPLDREPRLTIGTNIWAVGCALLHDPILTPGQITHLGDEIDYMDYWMSNASIIFGNSGGAIFVPLDGKYYFTGIPSRVDIVGWGTPVTHLGYFSPVHRIYKFLDERIYQFIYDSAVTEDECEKMRKSKEDVERRRLSLEPVDMAPQAFTPDKKAPEDEQ